MVEISKEAKIIILINVIVSLLYAFFFLGIPEIYRDLTNGSFFSPVCWRQLGGTFLVIGIFGIIVLIRKEWEQIRIFWELGIVFLIMLICLDIWGIIIYLVIDYTVFVEIVLTAINIFFYLRERK